MNRVTDGENILFIPSLSEMKKEEVTRRILKALGDYMNENPDDRRDFPPVTDSRGKAVVPRDSYVFYAPLTPDGSEREAVFIYTL